MIQRQSNHHQPVIITFDYSWSTIPNHCTCNVAKVKLHHVKPSDRTAVLKVWSSSSTAVCHHPSWLIVNHQLFDNRTVGGLLRLISNKFSSQAEKKNDLELFWHVKNCLEFPAVLRSNPLQEWPRGHRLNFDHDSLITDPLSTRNLCC